jgi:outer membrane immunogenic protein
MKKVIFAGIVMALSPGVGMAADLPLKSKPLLEPAMIASWTGLYVGGHVGGAWGYSDWYDPPPAPFLEAGIRPGGFLGGVQAGYNLQIQQVVLGIEGDVSWARVNGEQSGCYVDPLQSCSTKISQFATLAARFGVTWGSALLYAKGGVAWGKFEYNNPCPACLSPNYTASSNRSGWMAGAGVEYALSRSWSVKLEYNYLDFGTKRLLFSGSVPGDVFEQDQRDQVHMVKAGLNYRFDWMGPVVAKY